MLLNILTKMELFKNIRLSVKYRNFERVYFALNVMPSFNRLSDEQST